MDETKLVFSGHRDGRKRCTTHTILCGASIMLRECFSASGIGNLIKVEGIKKEDMWRFGQKTSSSQQLNGVWVIALFSNATTQNTLHTPGEGRLPEDQHQKSKPWLESYWKSVEWTEDQGPWQDTITSGGEIPQRRMDWDCSADAWETRWKLQLTTAGCYPAKRTHNWLLASVVLIILTLVMFVYFKWNYYFFLMCKVKWFKHPQ